MGVVVGVERSAGGGFFRGKLGLPRGLVRRIANSGCQCDASAMYGEALTRRAIFAKMNGREQNGGEG